jgi:hypothetical protein
MEDTLTCPICGRTNLNLMTKHIRLHKITKEEFLSKYPGFKMQTDKSKLRYSIATKEQFSNYTEEQHLNHSLHSKERAKDLQKWRQASGYNSSDEVKKVFLKNRNDAQVLAKTDSDMFSRLYHNRKDPRPKTSETLRTLWKTEKYVDSIMTNRRGRGAVKNYSEGRFRSTWENTFASHVKDLNESYKYEPFTIDYVHDGKLKRYTPDFFIPKYNLVIEVKPNKLINDLVLAKAQAVIDQGYQFFLFTETHLNDLNLFDEFIKTL